MAIAALTMYSEPAAVSDAYKDLVQEVAQRLGVRLQPAPSELAMLWRHSQLLLAQTCGYPWATQLQETAKLVAAPQYTFDGCEGATHCSFILVPESSNAISLNDLRGRRVAINGKDSNSGMNLLRDAVAPLAKYGRFFGEVIESGSHAKSMTMLRQGEADVAAVDAVTYGYLQRDVPDRVAGLRILQRTRQSPALPLITAAVHDDEKITALREELSTTLLERPDLMKILALRGFEAVNDATYLPVLEWEHEATRRGYPVIA